MKYPRQIKLFIQKFKAWEAQFGRAELWRCLGCKFKSYLEQLYITN